MGYALLDFDQTSIWVLYACCAKTQSSLHFIIKISDVNSRLDYTGYKKKLHWAYKLNRWPLLNQYAFKFQLETKITGNI